MRAQRLARRGGTHGLASCEFGVRPLRLARSTRKTRILEVGELDATGDEEEERRAATAPPAGRGRDARQSEETGLTVESR